MKTDNVRCFINEVSYLTSAQMERFLLEMKLERMFPTRPKFPELRWIHCKTTTMKLFDKYFPESEVSK